MSRAVRCGTVLIATLLVSGCIEPQDRRPGFHLGGEAAPFEADWSFTDQHREIALEVHTPYLLPHSITIWCASVGGQLYVAAREPDTKHWPGWVDRDPRVRLGIGDRVYDARLTTLVEPAEIAGVQRAYAAKYELPSPPPAGAPPLRYWSVSAAEG